MNPLTNVILIGLGGAAGSISRYLVGGYVQRNAHAGFPYGTLAVNVVGSLLVGLLTGYMMNTQTHPFLRPALVVGFCGGFTTFSTFSIEAVGLLSGGEVGKGSLYVVASAALCLAAAGLGFAVARR